MSIGISTLRIGIGARRRGSAGPAFDPADEFGDGVGGFVIDASDSTSLFTDAAGTTNVSATDDPVGLWSDLGPNGTDFSQATSPDRATYKDDGTYQWVEGDGVSDKLRHFGPILNGPGPKSIFLAIQNPSATVNDRFANFGGRTSGDILLTPELGVRTFGGNKLWENSDSTAAMMISYFIPDNSDTTDITCYVNGVLQTPTSSSANNISPGDDGSLFAELDDDISVGHAASKIYCMCVYNADKSAKRADFEAWMVERSPVGAIVTIPATMTAPTLTGGTESASITLGPAPDDGGDPITSYGYEVTDSADTSFTSPTAQGTQAPANLGAAIDISPLVAGDYIARQRATNSVGDSNWSPASAVGTVTPLVLPTYEASQVFTPDPTQTEIVLSDQGGFGIVNGPSAFPCLVDVRGMAEFDGVTNGAGERLNFLYYGSQDHSTTASVYLYCVFGAFRGGTWKAYATALADGDLSTYGGTTPATSGDGWIFNHNPTTPISSETPWVWKEGSTWYLTYHGFFGELGQTTHYATSTSPFGPFTNQGGFLATDAKSNHNGYARMIEIPPEAEVSGPLASGTTGQFFILAFNDSEGQGHYAVHIANRDLTGAQMLTAVNKWEHPAPIEFASEGSMSVGPRLMPTTFRWVGSEFAAMFEASLSDGRAYQPGAIVETGLAKNMLDYTRKPKVILHSDDVPLIRSDGTITTDKVEKLIYPQIIEDGGQTWLLVNGKNSSNITHIFTMPITVDTDAQGTEPRVFEDHYYADIDLSQYATIGDIPAEWIIDHGNKVTEITAEIKNGRLELGGNTALAPAGGFNPATTDWVRFYGDGSYGTDPGDTSEFYWYSIGSAIGGGSPSLSFARSEATHYQASDGSGKVYFTPVYNTYNVWPGGLEWDIANQKLRAQHGNGVARHDYDLTSAQTADLTAQQMYPYFSKHFAGSEPPLSIGKMSVRYRGSGHTNNAAPVIASASTDASGTKVTVTLDREFLGRYGLVLSVGGTVIDTTPARVDRSTIELVRDAGTFGASDEIKLHYQAGGDIRSDPQWVYLAAVSGINVVNNVA